MTDDFEEEESEPKLGDWKKWLLPSLPVILAAAFWLIFHGKLGFREMDYADLIFFGIVGGWTLIKLPEQALYNRSPKFLYANGHDTCAGSWETVGNYAVVTKGIDAFGIKYTMKSPVYVCPSDALTKKGRSLVASAWMKESGLEEVPPVVHEYIISQGLRPPYFVGYADIEQYLKVVDIPQEKIDASMLDGLSKAKVSYMIDELIEKNKQVNMLQGLLDEAYGTTEKSIASKRRIYDRMTGESPLKKAGKWITGGGERKEEQE